MDRDEPPTVANGTTEDEIDIDFILLGADFPDDVDDGPVDDDPEQSHSSFGDYYLPAKRCGDDTALGLERGLADRLIRIATQLPSPSSTRMQLTSRFPRHSFGETYVVSSVQEWREHLAIFLI